MKVLSAAFIGVMLTLHATKASEDIALSLRQLQWTEFALIMIP